VLEMNYEYIQINKEIYLCTGVLEMNYRIAHAFSWKKNETPLPFFWKHTDAGGRKSLWLCEASKQWAYMNLSS
jgi:hypothetical protein